MLKTFDLETERFSGSDYQENKFAKIFSIPRNILHANNYSDDIHLVFSVYWLSNFHYTRHGLYSLTVKQNLSNCLLQYLGEKSKTYMEGGVCYKITDNDIEIYVKPSANGYATRVVIEGNSKFYLYGKWYNYSEFQDIDESTLTKCEVVNNDYNTLTYKYLSHTLKNNVVTTANHNETTTIFTCPYYTEKIYSCNLKVKIECNSAGNGQIKVYVNGEIYDNIPVSYTQGSTLKYINLICPIKSNGNMYCQFYHYNNNSDSCTITVTPRSN